MLQVQKRRPIIRPVGHCLSFTFLIIMIQHRAPSRTSLGWRPSRREFVPCNPRHETPQDGQQHAQQPGSLNGKSSQIA
jgi:hypothetical protein